MFKSRYPKSIKNFFFIVAAGCFFSNLVAAEALYPQGLSSQGKSVQELSVQELSIQGMSTQEFTILAQQAQPSQPRLHTTIGEGKRKNWRDQLPEITQDAADYHYQVEEEPTANLSPRIADKTHNSINEKLQYSKTTPVEAGKKSDVTPLNTKKIDNIPGEVRYTVQLGAFVSEQALNRYIDQNGLATLEGWQSEKAIKKGKQWHLIVWGLFETWQEAEIAWLEQQKSYPIVDYWIRTVDSRSQENHQAGL